MLDRSRVMYALEREREAFVRYGAEQRQQQHLADRWLRLFEQHSSDELSRQVAGIPWPGALPTPELDEAGGLLMPFLPSWENHQEARAWALQTLKRQCTIAVDGSQIAPDPIYTIPVGAIQVGWFVNPHDGEQDYVKDIEFAVLPPDELRGADDEEESFPVQTVNQRRFVRECERLSELMVEYGGGNGRRPALSFFDGSFIISFAGKIRAGRAQPYVQSVRDLLATSAQLRSPLVGFVDMSNSRDIANLVQNLGGQEPGQPAVSDSALLRTILPHWGDRTPFFICARPDALSRDEPGIFYKDVVFCYIRLNQQRPPARLEMPRWLLENGQAEQVVNLVRAECVVGGGYPYAIETADALAVLSYADRQRFYAILGEFLAEAGLTLHVARKALSKQQRR